jgi:peptide/nickel transport system permease protein
MTAGAASFPPELTPMAPDAAAPPSAGAEGPRARTYWGQVLQYVSRSGRARAGMVWIAFLLAVALFAPLLANSQPLLLKEDGRWSSPAARAFTAVDYGCFAVACASMFAALFRGTSLAVRTLFVIGFTMVVVVLAAIFTHPPETVDWQRYRDLRRAGQIQWELLAPLPYSPNDYQRDNPEARLNPPSWSHLLGTETNGADIMSRMIHASRIALSIGLISTGISVIIGITIGGAMGYFAGTVDILGMRLIEIFEAIPTLFLLITFVAFFGRNLYIMMAIIGLTGWTDEARFIRAEFLRLRNQDFVLAAIAAGLPLRSVLFRHLLPNGISPILVTSSFGIASAILYESTLSFLGLGLIEQPSWGQLLNQALDVGGTFTWWIALFPGLAIFLTVFSYNLIGESLRDALDPKIRKQE